MPVGDKRETPKGTSSKDFLNLSRGAGDNVFGRDRKMMFSEE